MIENDLEEPFHSWVPVSSSMGQAREGIHFGLIDTIFTALKEFDNISEKCKAF